MTQKLTIEQKYLKLKQQKVLQLGHGWLGQSLTNYFAPQTAKWLIVRKSSSPTNHLTLDLSDESYWPQIYATLQINDINILCIHLPPRSWQIPFLHELRKHFHGTIILSSSIGIYHDDHGKVDETTPVSPTNDNQQLLYNIERSLTNFQDKQSFIIRWGGLIDKDRQLENFLKGKSPLLRPYAPINLIHRSDCKLLINNLLQQYKNFPKKPHTINAVTINHLYRIHYYHRLRHQFDHTDTRRGKLVTSIYPYLLSVIK